eukprot:TRINITY_DN16337_c0_g1_i1.p1 TRINITY_DN16337_c0_g1~~TRINITY_DN16337_c0_g1_i1.p1  ORF type:complete len:333 (+),score=79.96 TRINITY_DN16337_c0_g1_i1:132-1130(+)
MKTASLLLLLVLALVASTAVRAQSGENCTAVVDLMLTVDGSSSITDQDWQDALAFLYDVVLGFQVSSDAAHIGVVQFALASVTKVVVPLTGELNVLETGLNGMTKLGGGTNIAVGIDDSQDQISQYGRNGVPHVMIVMTDGKEDDPYDPQNPVVAAGNAKLAGTIIFGIGVGDDVDVGTMQQIVSPPYENYYFPVSSYANLSTILEKTVLSVCHPTTSTASSAASASSGTRTTQTTQTTQSSTGGTRSGQTSGGSRSSTGGGSKTTQSTTGGGTKCGPYNTCQMGDICCSDGTNSNDPYYCCPGAERCCYGNCCEHGYECYNNQCVFDIFDA